MWRLISGLLLQGPAAALLRLDVVESGAYKHTENAPLLWEIAAL
jgi:hypothetical protein